MTTLAHAAPHPRHRLPGILGIDHVAFTVASLSGAVDLVQTEWGGELCYVEGPILHPDDWMARKLGVPARAEARVAMMCVGQVNLELFEYTGTATSRQAPPWLDDGSAYLLVEVGDLAATCSRLEARPGAHLLAKAVVVKVDEASGSQAARV